MAQAGIRDTGYHSRKGGGAGVVSSRDGRVLQNAPHRCAN